MKNKIMLITGGTGSFGNAVLQDLLNTEIKEIRIFSRDEKKQDEMRQLYANNKIKYYLGDVRDKHSIDNAMRGVDCVFHAAALKQVPSCEFFPMEAVRTNVIGTENVIDSAIQSGVKKLILLSSDKAIYPINAMGMSKALGEKILIAKSRNVNHSDIILCVARYGNVMASRGSVIPLLIDQIKAGKPLTITDPNMTRFMMTLQNAVELIMFAFEKGKQGDVFIQKAPAASIQDLAVALTELYKSKSGMRIIGTRHGEKLFETLITREEMVKAKDLGDYYCIPADTRDLNYGLFFTEGESKVSKLSDYTSHNTRKLTVDEIKKLLLKLDMVKNDLKQ